MDWEINIKYGSTTFTLQAEKLYESNQIMRIKVYGSKGFIVFENDYPYLQHTQSKKAIKWKVRESTIANNLVAKDAQLIAEIITALNYLVKGKHTKMSQAEFLRLTKR